MSRREYNELERLQAKQRTRRLSDKEKNRLYNLMEVFEDEQELVTFGQ